MTGCGAHVPVASGFGLCVLFDCGEHVLNVSYFQGVSAHLCFFFSGGVPLEIKQLWIFNYTPIGGLGPT